MKQVKTVKRLLVFALAISMAGGNCLPALSIGDNTTAIAAEKTTTTFPEYYPDSALKKMTDAEIDKTVDALLKAMTTAEKYSLMGGNGTGSQGNAGYLKGVPRLGVPESKMYDGPAGVLSLYDTTNPPQEQMLAATWNQDLAYKYGEIHGAENKAIGGNVQLGAQFDITRSPYFGRAKDQMGEDSFLLSSLSAPLTQGIQDQNVVAVAKHFAVFSQDATPATNTNIQISEQALHETHLAGFESAVTKGGLSGMMSSYNMINATFASAHKYLQVDVLRDMWNYNGFTVTDWGGNFGNTIDQGTDIEMPSLSANSQAASEKLIASGKLTQAQVDQAAAHVLTALGEVGYLGLVEIGKDGMALEEPGRTAAIKLKEDTEKLKQVQQESNKTSLAVAEEGGVLLKNENNTLPLSTAGGKSVAVIGLNGMRLMSGVGGERSYGTIAEMTSPYEALADILGETNVEGQVAMDTVGTAIPASAYYKTASGSAISANNGIARTYGVGDSAGSSEEQQGQIKTSGTMEKTKMGDHEIGEDTGIVDTQINFTTGTVDGKPNKTYKTKGADAGSASSFPLESGAAYTWTSYIEAPETGQYSIILGGIGGAINAAIQTGVDAKGDATSVTLGISSINQGTQWPSDVCSDTGMALSKATVTLEAGKLYKVIVAGVAKLEQKDLQVSLSWITPSQKAANYENALQAAEQNDISVVFAYTTSSALASTREASTLALPAEQEKLILDVAAKAHSKGHKVVVVLNNSTAVTMGNWIDEADAILEMYYPGQEGGKATANLLSGKTNPSGKLAYTIPKKDTDTLDNYTQEIFDNQSVKEDVSEEFLQAKIDSTKGMFGYQTDEEALNFLKNMGFDGKMNTSKYEEGILIGYKWYDSMGIEPQYDFGYGLSYTTFKYSDMTVIEKKTDKEQAGYDVTFNVTNTGSVKGSEVAQVYLGEAKVPTGIQSAKYALAGYEKIKGLEAGETRTVTIHINERSLSYWNTNGAVKELSDGTSGKWTVATGTRTLYVGSSSDNLLMNKDITVNLQDTSTGGNSNGGGSGSGNNTDNGNTDNGGTDTEQTLPQKNTVVKKSGAKYKITRSDAVNGTVAYMEPTSSTKGSYVIPDTIKINGITFKVTRIASDSFRGNKTVIEVTVGKNVKSIGKNAFKNCESLTTVTLNKNVASIEEKAFAGCTKLKVIKLKTNKLTTIENNAFKAIAKNAKFKVPEKKYADYKVLVRDSKVKSSVKFVKY